MAAIQLGGEFLETINTDGGAKALSVAGNVVWIDATLTRTGDTVQYAAGDQVASGTASPAALEFSSIGRGNGGGGVIVAALAIDTFNQATKPNQRLMLFDGTAAPTPNGDNAAWNPTDADMNNLFAEIEFSSWTTAGTTVGTGGNAFSIVRGLNIPYRCGAAVDDIWGEVVERGTYTPGSAEAWKYRLGVVR